jgi:transglutaminase superfamily protein/coenzyme PQQ synthesis protein D (PqqD)
MQTNSRSIDVSSKAMENRYVLSPSVIFVPVEDGTARLLDMDGEFFAVSTTGARMLQETLSRGPAAAAEVVAREYKIDENRAKADLDAYLDELQRKGLIATSRLPKASTAGKVVESLFLRLALHLIDRCLWSRSAKASGMLIWARIAVHSAGWIRTVQVLSSYYRQKPQDPGIARFEEAVKDVNDSLAQAGALQFFRMNCKERAMCCWALLRSAGLPAALVVGISLVPLSAHCWCRLDKWIVGDVDPDFYKQYLPVTQHT